MSYVIYRGDNSKIYLGGSNDASLYYDGSDFILDSQEVGSGGFTFKGGNVTIENDLTISGNLLIDGTTLTSITETVQVEDNVMLLNYGEAGAGVTAGTAGIRIDRGSSTDYLMIFNESIDKVQIGLEDALHAVSTEDYVNSEIASHDSTSTHYLESEIDHNAIMNVGSNTHTQIDTHIADTSKHIDWTEEGGGDITYASGKIGVGVTASEKFAVDGAITIGSALGLVEGSIQYSSGSFTGYDGTSWIEMGTSGVSAGSHIADLTIHFTEAEIDHTAIQNIGTNSHSDIDTHIGNDSVHLAIGGANTQIPYNNNGSWGGTGITWDAGTSAANFPGNVTIQGDLVVDGTSFTTLTETVQIEDNVMVLNYGEVGAGVTEGTAGLRVDRGSSTDYLLIFDETDDNLKMGLEGALHAIASENYVNSEIYSHDSTSTHYLESEIDHNAIMNVGSNTHTQIDTHIGDATKHFTEGNIDHTAIQNIGTYSHDELDAHIDSTSLHVLNQIWQGDSDVTVTDTGSGSIGMNINGTNYVTLDANGLRLCNNGDQTPAAALQVVIDGAPGSGLIFGYNNNSWGGGSISLGRGRGNIGSPSGVESGDTIGTVNFAGHNGTTPVNAAQIYAKATEDWIDSTSSATKLIFYTTPNDSVTNTKAITIDQDQKLILHGGGGSNGINEFSTDGTMADNSDDAVPTEAAVVTRIATDIAAHAGSNTHAQIDTHIEDTSKHIDWAEVGNGDIHYDSGSLGIGAAPDSTSQLYVSGNIKSTGNLEVGGGVRFELKTITTDYTVLEEDYTIILNASGGNVTATVPDPSTADNKGQVYVLKAVNIDNTAKVSTAGGTIDGASDYTFTSLYESITIQSDGSNYHII